MQKTTKQLLAGFLSATLAVTALPVTSLAMPQKEAKAASVTLQNPRIVKDDSMKAGQKVTWDCIWFGSYPQREVVADAASYSDEPNFKTKVMEDAELFQKLESATEWVDDEIIIDGNKYRRAKRTSFWSEDKSWHYFKYEPIKWRVLEAEENQIFLLSDQTLDSQNYNTTDEREVTWQESSLRSWLNGYRADQNLAQKDYANDNFMNDAFSENQQQAIAATELQNKTLDGEDEKTTTDKIFLLSYQEIKSESFGFARVLLDEAKKSISSAYTEIKEVYSSGGYCEWWLRTPGSNLIACNVSDGGYVYTNTEDLTVDRSGIRPALNLNLSSSDLWSYAGTVCSDGTVDEQAKPGSGDSDNNGNNNNGNSGNIGNNSNETNNNGGNIGGDGNSVITPQTKTPAPGTVIRTEDAIYRVTAVGTKGNTAALVKPLKKTNSTFVIPATIKSEDGKFTFKVTAISKNAFQKNTKLKKVTIGENVSKIGANAFSGCKKLKNIKITSTQLTKKSVGKNAFKGIAKKAVIKVPKKKRKAYKNILKGKGQAKSVKIKK